MPTAFGAYPVASAFAGKRNFLFCLNSRISGVRPELIAWWNEIGTLAKKRQAEMASELETCWNEIAPYGERFYADKGTALLLHDVTSLKLWSGSEAGKTGGALPDNSNRQENRRGSLHRACCWPLRL